MQHSFKNSSVLYQIQKIVYMKKMSVNVSQHTHISGECWEKNQIPSYIQLADRFEKNVTKSL